MLLLLFPQIMYSKIYQLETYTVNVRDVEGCIASETITLSLPDPITATFTPSTTVLDCFGDQNASSIQFLYG